MGIPVTIAHSASLRIFPSPEARTVGAGKIWQLGYLSAGQTPTAWKGSDLSRELTLPGWALFGFVCHLVAEKVGSDRNLLIFVACGRSLEVGHTSSACDTPSLVCGQGTPLSLFPALSLCCTSLVPCGSGSSVHLVVMSPQTLPSPCPAKGLSPCPGKAVTHSFYLSVSHRAWAHTQ